MKTKIYQVVIGLALVLAAVLCALPWTTTGAAPQASTSLGTVVPLTLLFAAAFWRPSLVAAWAAFSAGLVVDVTSGGPLGFWPLINLLTLALARAAGQAVRTPTILAGWTAYAATAVALSVVAWVVRSLYQFELSAWAVVGWPLLSTIAVFPLLAGLLVALLKWREAGRALRTVGSE